MNKEQLAGKDATISCIVTGLTKQLSEVKWQKSDNSYIVSGEGGYTISEGNFADGSQGNFADGYYGNFGDGSQTTVLTVAGDKSKQDTTFRCHVKQGMTEKISDVHLKFFSKLLTNLYNPILPW